MSFWSIAQPFIQLGIPVIPLAPGEKRAVKEGWPQLATTDPATVRQWDLENPHYNVGLVAGDFCFLEFDQFGIKAAAEEMGQAVPVTRIQKSGSGGTHLIFRHTELSRLLGNRSVNCNGKEWFSFRASNKYLVGAGSVHPNGRLYTSVRDVEPIAVPDWVCDFIQKHSQPAMTEPKRTLAVSDDFDFDEFCEHYGIIIRGEKDDVWQIVEECPGVGYRHENSVLTGFYWDGSTLGWSCFAQGCPTHGMSIGQLIGFLNKTNQPYSGVIWDRDDEDEEGFSVKWVVDIEEQEHVQVVVTPQPEPLGHVQKAVDDYTDGFEEVALEVKRHHNLPMLEEIHPEPQPALTGIRIHDDEHEGLEFPGDCAMYGKLAKIANSLPLLQNHLGFFYPSLLGVASALPIEPASSIRPNLYVANLAPIGTGKTVCQEAALKSIYIPGGERVVATDSPGSHSGLMKQLYDDEVNSLLLFPDELMPIMNSCAILGSNLPQMLCTLWNKDQTGGAVKTGRHIVYGRLSIVGALPVKDTAEFAKMFGVHSVSGLYDRFLFGYSTAKVKYRDMYIVATFFDIKPVHVRTWVWDAKDEWIGNNTERGRLAQNVLRIALVTAACNEEVEITRPCMEAAFRFMEWQERLRQVFKPGVAETKEAECYEAVYAALKERYDKQKATKEVPKGADKLITDMPMENRWKLLNFRVIVNNKSYYRKYAGLIDRVKRSMLDGGIIAEFKEEEEDETGKVKKVKTPFVMLQSLVR